MEGSMKNDITKINVEKIQEIWGKVQQNLGEQIKPRIMIGGKTGVGKSSLLNSILGSDAYEVGVIPTTRENIEKIWSSSAGDIVVIDSPGFGEAESDNVELSDENELIRKIEKLNAHIFILVIKADDRSLELEQGFLKMWNDSENLSGIPLIIAVNQIDKITPVRVWEPKSLDLKLPRTEKEKNIKKYLEYLGNINYFQDKFVEKKLIPVSAGESANDPMKYGINDLRRSIYLSLPDSAKTVFARSAKLRNHEARRIIRNYSIACSAAVTANFMPTSDALILAPIQVAMILHLGKLYKIEVTKSLAASLLSSIGLTLSGRLGAQFIISLIPGIKNIVGPVLAFNLTYTIGNIISSIFSENKLSISKDEIAELAKKYFEDAKAAGEKLLDMSKDPTIKDDYEHIEEDDGANNE